jgi:uncharacterized transporter YbjL
MKEALPNGTLLLIFALTLGHFLGKINAFGFHLEIATMKTQISI